MKEKFKIYLFLTSLFFMFAPFSLGLTVIYFEDTLLMEWTSGLIVNVCLWAILGIVIGILIKKKKILNPTRLELKLLLFGILSNVVLYFYTFQNSLKIDHFITIYFSMILILLLYQVIIDRKKFNYELWIIAVLFFSIDIIHFNFVSSHNDLVETDYINANLIQRIMYISIPLATLALFITKIRKYHVMDYFAYVFIGIIALMPLIFFESIDSENKFILTLNLLIPFVIITDLIVSKIYKKFNIYKITFYIRMGTIALLIYIYEDVHYFVKGSFSSLNLAELVMITYVIIICNLIEYLIPKKI